jgi:hypothetical protein
MFKLELHKATTFANLHLIHLKEKLFSLENNL